MGAQESLLVVLLPREDLRTHCLTRSPLSYRRHGPLKLFKGSTDIDTTFVVDIVSAFICMKLLAVIILIGDVFDSWLWFHQSFRFNME